MEVGVIRNHWIRPPSVSSRGIRRAKPISIEPSGSSQPDPPAADSKNFVSKKFRHFSGPLGFYNDYKYGCL